MDESRKSSIANALREYRETILQQNLTSLRILANGMEQQLAPAKLHTEAAQRLRIHAFEEHYLGGTVTDLANTPDTLLSDDPSIRKPLVQRFGLDGVIPLQPETAARRAEWFTRMREVIARGEVHHDVAVAHFPPPDLEHLGNLVDGICGPGLPYQRQIEQIGLLSPMTEAECARDPARRMELPISKEEVDLEEYDDSVATIWCDLDIAVACKIGDGVYDWSGSYALFCRRKGGKREEWKWRFALHNEDWSTDAFDDVEEYLRFHATYGIYDEEHVRKDIRSLEVMM